MTTSRPSDSASASMATAVLLQPVSSETAVVQLGGEWLNPACIVQPEDIFGKDALPPSVTVVALQPSPENGIAAWNSALISFVYIMRKYCDAHGRSLDITALPDGVQALLELALAVPERDYQRQDSAHNASLFASLTRKGRRVLNTCRRIFSFIGMLFCALVLFCLGRTRTRGRSIAEQFARAGHDALPIITLINFLIGVILAFIGCVPMRTFGAEIYVASLIGIGILRMMAPVTVGVVMAGRTGAAYTAELGAMKSNDEIHAYSVLALSPMEVLVLPRFLALSVAMPLLCIYADFVGVLGGLTIGVWYSKLGAVEYLRHLIKTTNINHFYVGLFTAFVFGALIAACGCYNGLHCERNAIGVGKSTTTAVVASIICMVLSTAVITVITVLFSI